MRVADLRAAFGRTVGRARALAYRILDTVPPVRRTVDERVWQVDHRGGVVGRRRCLSWLFGWLIVSQLIGAVTWIENSLDVRVLDPLWFLLAAVLNSLIWWWSMRVLLFSRVPWRALAL